MAHEKEIEIVCVLFLHHNYLGKEKILVLYTSEAINVWAEN